MKSLLQILPTLCTLVLGSACTGVQSAKLATKEQSLFSVSCEVIELSQTGSAHLFELRKPAAPVEYAVVNEARSKSGAFTVQTLFASDMSIIKVTIPRYPHSRGREATRSKFLNQFINGNTQTKVDAVTGATSSSKAIENAVRQAARILKKHLLSEQSSPNSEAAAK